MARDDYSNPLCARYASKEMRRIFSDENKFTTWRKLWIALAEAERELGLDITEAQINELKRFADDVNYNAAEAREKITRHDVMAHIYAYGEQCPLAKPIIHLGATSCYVGDNADIIIMKQATARVRGLLALTVKRLTDFAEKHKNLPTLAYTHFQAAQPTTVGKRAALWAQDFIMDLEQLNFADGALKPLGCRGTTGTGASFLELFNGDKDKVFKLEKLIIAKLGFSEAYAVSGQTYPRKADYYVMSVLSGIAQSVYKFSNDFRLLSHLKEFDEPFEEGQVGSSAMAYKRNPMRSERAASLSRHVIALAQDAANTAAAQWFERTLDDSANRRIAVPEAFLAVDAVLGLVINIITDCAVYPGVIEKHLKEELPFMATENILMQCVKDGGDRQALHEVIREHSVAAAENIKRDGGENDLLDRLAADSRIGMTRERLEQALSYEKFTGVAAEQTEAFVKAARGITEQAEEIHIEVRV
jgi:adenylosuccinate lyase